MPILVMTASRLEQSSWIPPYLWFWATPDSGISYVWMEGDRGKGAGKETGM